MLQGTASERVRIYVFGSALHADRIKDVDVAVVTDDFQALQMIQAQVSSDHDLQVVDLIVLSSSEEKELNFLKTVAAVEVSRIDWTS